MKYLMSAAISILVASSADAYVIRAAWSSVGCSAYLKDGNATLDVSVGGKVVMTTSSGYTQEDADALAAWCAGIVNAAASANGMSSVTGFVMIDPYGKADNGSALYNEPRSNCPLGR